MRLVLLLLLHLTAITTPVWGGELRVGAASVFITPPVGIPMAGYYAERGAKGVHDDLYAKAIVLEAEGSAAALVALDLITTPRDLVEEARREIERDHGNFLRQRNDQRHAFPYRPGPGHEESVRWQVGAGGKRYRAALPAKIADAVRQAETRLAPPSSRPPAATRRSIAFNRRFHMKDGTVGWNPGKRNPQDPQARRNDRPRRAGRLLSRSLDRKPLATYVNYAVHLDNIGEPLISADMPATLQPLPGRFQGAGDGDALHRRLLR